MRLAPVPAPALSRGGWRGARGFHSYDHPPTFRDGNPFSGAAERALLAAALRRVPEHGFSADALALGARDAGLLDISAALITDGPFDLVRWHLIEQREALAAHAEDVFAHGEQSRPLPSVAEKVEELTWRRLCANVAIIHRWQEVHCHTPPTVLMRTPSHLRCYGTREQENSPLWQGG